MLGLAVGDALGAVCEFKSIDEIKSEWGVLREMVPWRGKQAGNWTDDTEMSISVAKALIRNPNPKSLESTLDVMAEEFAEWGRMHDPNRGPGSACRYGAGRLGIGIDWHLSGKPNGNGCGAPMRVAPIGLFYHGAIHLEMCEEVAWDQGWMTHRGRDTCSAAVVIALMISRILEGDSVRVAGDWVLHQQDTVHINDRARECLRNALSVTGDLEGYLGLNEGWDGLSAMAASVACAANNETSFEEAVVTAANSPGDSDSLASITGALMGTILGTAAIPARWLDVLEQRTDLVELADKLYGKHLLLWG
jgi:ADP-ribosylglycohydrolase